MKLPSFFPAVLLVVCAGVASLMSAAAQTTIGNNSFYTADFQGKQETHNWILNLEEDFNDFRIQIESPVGEVLVLLIEPGQTKGTKLLPANDKCRAAATTGVSGKFIEATLPKDKKLGPGRHIIRVYPARPSRNVNKYSLKITQPTLSGSASPPPEADAPPPPTAEEKPAVPAAHSPADLLAELRASRAEVNELRTEVKQMREEMNRMGKRITELEASRKDR